MGLPEGLRSTKCMMFMSGKSPPRHIHKTVGQNEKIHIMNVKEIMRKFTLLILLSQTVIFFNSCAQNSNTSTEEELSKDKKCQTIKRYLNTHKTSLERKVKAPQNYEAFDSLNGTIK